MQLALILIMAGASSGAAFAGGNETFEDLSSLVKTALANNPGLKSSVADWKMNTAVIAQVSSYDDPMLMLDIDEATTKYPLDFQKIEKTKQVVGISQQIPYFGKLDLKGQAAAKQAESMQWMIDITKLELIRGVKDTYYQIYYTDKSLEIVNKNIRVLDDIITIAGIKYSVGQGMQQDIILAQVDRSKLLETKVILEQQRKSQEAALNALLYRRADTPVGRIPDFDVKPLAMTADDVRNYCWENNPKIKQLKADIAKAEVQLKLAHKEYYPDFNVFFDWGIRYALPPGTASHTGSTVDVEGLNVYTAGVNINIPIQLKRRAAAVEEAKANIMMTTEDLNNYMNGLDSAISDLLARLDKASKLVTLYKTGIIPQAQQSLESSTSNYRVNNMAFQAVLEARRTLFDYEQKYYENLAEYQKLVALGDAVVGVPLY